MALLLIIIMEGHTHIITVIHLMDIMDIPDIMATDLTGIKVTNTAAE